MRVLKIVLKIVTLEACLTQSLTLLPIASCVAGYESHPNSQFSSWKILALCTGLISIVYGVCMYLFLAGSVVTARWLSDDDRTLAVGRLRNNHQGVGSTQYKVGPRRVQHLCWHSQEIL